MSKRLTEFEKIKRQRIRKRMRKNIFYMLILFLILFFVYFFYRNNYYNKIANNVRGIFKVLKKGSGYPVRLNMTDIKDKSKMGSEILILDEDIISIFNKYGYKTLYKKHNLNDPRVISNNDRSIVFEHLDKKFKVYSKTQEIAKKELDNLIYNIELSDDNKIGIIKGSNRFVSSLEIWNNDYKPIFKWNSSDKYIMNMSFSKNNKNFVISSLAVDGVNYISTISFFNINNDKKISEINLNDEMIISLKYKNNNVCAIGTRGAYLINQKGKIINKYSYEDKSIKAFDNDFSKNVILIVDNYNLNESDSLILLNDKLEKKDEKNIEGKIKDISSNKKNVYILTEENIFEFNLSSHNLKKYNVKSIVSDIIVADNKVYEIDISKIDLLKMDNYLGESN